MIRRCNVLAQRRDISIFFVFQKRRLTWAAGKGACAAACDVQKNALGWFITSSTEINDSIVADEITVTSRRKMLCRPRQRGSWCWR